MPTQHPRIPVTKDESLAEALAGVAPLFPRKRPATIVHDLALKGAETLLREHQADSEAIERLVAWSTEESSDALDRDVLTEIDRLAWDR